MQKLDKGPDMSFARVAFTVALGASLSPGIAACGKSDTTAGGRPKVGIVIVDKRLNFASQMADGFEAGAKAAGGVDVTVTGPTTVDPVQQIKLFQELTKKARGGVSVETLTPEQFARPLAAAVKDGVPLIAVDTAPPPGSGVTLYVGNDNYELGQQLAAEAIKHLPANASGKVVLAAGRAGIPVLDMRAKGMRDEFEKQLPGVQVLGVFTTAQDPPSNLAAWKRLIKANPGALAFLGTGDIDAQDLAVIHKQMAGKWLAGAFDLDPKSMQAVKDGELFAVMSPEHYLKGAIAGRLQADHAKGKSDLPEGWIYTPGLVVNGDNIGQIMSREASDAGRSAWFKPKADKIVGNVKSSLRPLADAR
jgi:ribose transport system substrate-binding protein